MGLSQEMNAFTPKRALPLKPKKISDSSFLLVSDSKMLPKKPDTSSDLTNIWDNITAKNIFEDMEMNTPSMEEFDFPANMDEEMVTAMSTPQMNSEDINDIWGNLDNVCITQAQAEGKDDNVWISEAQHEGEDEVLEIMVPTATINEPESLSEFILINPQDNDVLKESLEMSGINLNSLYQNLTVAPVIPEPVPSTSTFLSLDHVLPSPPPISPPEQSRTLQTIDITGLTGLEFTCFPASLSDTDSTFNATPSLKSFTYSTLNSTPNPLFSTDSTFTCSPSPIPSTFPSIPTTIPSHGEDIKDDPDWSPVTEQWNKPCSSRTNVHVKKTKLNAVQKQDMKKKKPGRPERQEDYTITEVPSRRMSTALSQEELQGLKYRRMRDLNNKASKICRAKRKSKQMIIEEELEEQQQRKKELTLELASMEQQVEYYRQMINQ